MMIDFVEDIVSNLVCYY